MPDPRVSAIDLHDDPPICKGTEIGNQYVVLDKLGKGGVGSVWKVKRLRSSPNDPCYAMKILDRDSGKDRFQREATTLWKIQHPNVIQFVDSGRWGNRYYLVIAVADGGSLHDWIIARHHCTPDVAAWILFQTIQGLRASKAVHRDLKPENLLLFKGAGKSEVDFVVGDPNAGARVVVADWGLVTRTSDDEITLTKTKDIFGTPLYMSPEQCRSSKHVDARSDIYTLGIILYELLTGDVPFLSDDQFAMLRAHIEDEVKYPPNMDPDAKRVVMRCLEKDPDNRYQSLRDLQTDLRELMRLPVTWRYLDGTGSTTAQAPPTSLWARIAQWIGRLLPRRS